MVIAIVIVLLVLVTLLFHFTSPWWFTPIASNWSTVDQTITVTFWVTGVVFVAVNLFLAYAIYRYRYNKYRRADYNPENRKLEGWLTVGTSIGIISMLAPGLFVWAQFVNVPTNADVVEVVGQQWHWSFRFPGKDGQFGRTSTLLIDERNPFGIDPEDPQGLDDKLINSNELHLPIHRDVKLLLRSKDVLHNFAVPQFRVKMDLVPGLSSYMWFTPTRAGRFEILCMELCGMAHYTMRGHVVIEEETAFQTWLNQQPTFQQSINEATADLSAGKQLYVMCVACHGDKAQGNKLTGAPQLAGQGKWYLERQLKYFKQHIRGNTQGDTYGRQMQPFAQALNTKEAISNISAYLNSLPRIAPITNFSGDINNGKNLYRNCAFCHGQAGQGIYAQNAPRLANQHDWYLKRQLINFQQNVRGKHPQDLYGSQMILMSKLLQDEQALDDVITYIATLEATKEPIK